MILYLIKPERYYNTILPERVKGQYWIKDFDKQGNERKLISIEAVGSEWVIKSNKKVVVLNEHNTILKNTVVRPMSFLNIRIGDSTDRIILFAEPVTPERGKYFKDADEVILHSRLVLHVKAELTVHGFGLIA